MELIVCPLYLISHLSITKLGGLYERLRLVVVNVGAFLKNYIREELEALEHFYYCL
jgi:hypothetical protein